MGHTKTDVRFDQSQQELRQRVRQGNISDPETLRFRYIHIRDGVHIRVGVPRRREICH